MKHYIPSIYSKSVLEINYDNLYNNGIRYILFDLDNTLIYAKSKEITNEIIELIKELKKKFTVIIASNSRKKRVAEIARILDVDFVSFARKPSFRAFIIIQKRYNCNKDEIIIIGDQLMTDIKGGNKYGIRTVLVDPLGKDLFVTFFNRWYENRTIKKLTKKGNLERGKYYD